MSSNVENAERTIKLDGSKKRWPDRLNDTVIKVSYPVFAEMPAAFADHFENVAALNSFVLVSVTNAKLNRLDAWLKDEANVKASAEAVQKYVTSLKVPEPQRKTGGDKAKVASAEARAEAAEKKAREKDATIDAAAKLTLEMIRDLPSKAKREEALAKYIRAKVLPEGTTL